MATLSTGADAEGGERFGNCEYNNIKNHWRTANPCASLSDLQPGMIVSDENDDRLYLATLISGCPCSEILQSCVPLSDDKYMGFGYDRDGDLGYNSTHCALMMGIPVATLDSGACERGLIIMDEADLMAGADVTGLVPPSVAEPSVFIVDSDLDSYLGVGLQVNDRPGIWTGPNDSIPLALQYEATADITMFEACGPGENRYAYIYGWDAGTASAKYLRFQVDSFGYSWVIAEERLYLQANGYGYIREGATDVANWTATYMLIYDDISLTFGTTGDGVIKYCEATNDAWIFGIPCAADKHGLVFCDHADIAADMTGLLPFRTLPFLTGVDADLDSYWEIGWAEDDVPRISAGGNASKIQFGVEQQVPMTISDVSDPPTDAELDVLWTSPAAVGIGWWTFLLDSNTGGPLYRIVSDGANWWYGALTMAV